MSTQLWLAAMRASRPSVPLILKLACRAWSVVASLSHQTMRWPWAGMMVLAWVCSFEILYLVGLLMSSVRYMPSTSISSSVVL